MITSFLLLVVLLINLYLSIRYRNESLTLFLNLAAWVMVAFVLLQPYL